MTKEELGELLDNAPFNVAKTMPNIPHAYTLLKNWEDKELFVECAYKINEYGVKEKFYSKYYTYFYYNGYKYWTMDYPISKTDLINRAKI